MRSRSSSAWFFFWVPCLLCLSVLAELFFRHKQQPVSKVASLQSMAEWQAPKEEDIVKSPDSRLIRYGKLLVESTAHYLGPKGAIATLTTGMNCQNCHLKGGTVNFANPFSATAATYPKYRDRSGLVESVAFRINECMKRSLNGGPLDSNSTEMQAIRAYIDWIGKDVPKGAKPRGAGTEELRSLARAADPGKGQGIFMSLCSRCHGENGGGTWLPDSSGFLYPPLWGEHSFNTAAGLFRISSLAGFIKNNMPFGVNWKQPQLTETEAWDVAAYIASQPRPEKTFPNDYKDLSKKPVDYPFGPYTDTFSEVQHKYGPFDPIKKKKG